MAGICTASTSPNNCSHRSITVNLDGTPITVPMLDASDPLTADELRQFVILGIRRLRAQGITLATFLNRVTHGDEATNVKQYDFIGPGSAITKTNIGTAYVNLLPGANGERILVDLTGCVDIRIVASVNVPVGTIGALGLRAVRDADNVVLFENAAISATPTGERELDTDWFAIPAGFLPGSLVLLRAQGKSATAADDPIIRRIALLTR